MMRDLVKKKKDKRKDTERGTMLGNGSVVNNTYH